MTAPAPTVQTPTKQSAGDGAAAGIDPESGYRASLQVAANYITDSPARSDK